ncbi:MAG: NYN domain-containing protein [Myxococcota bacterium]
MSSETPKAKSAAFRELRRRLIEIFRPASLRIVLFGALDRKCAEKILVKLKRGRRGEASGMTREDLMALVATAFFDNEGVAFEVARDLDRSTRAERSLVSSIPPAEVEEKLGSLDAIKFRRHSAKLLWALARDDRSEVWPVAGKVVLELIEQSRRLDEVRAGAHRKGADAELRELEALYLDAAERAMQFQEEASLAEREHARIVAGAGKQEVRLREEVERRKSLAAEISRMQKLGTPQVAPPSSVDRRGEGKLERKLRRLEKRLAAAERDRDRFAEAVERTAELEEEVARLRAKVESLRALRARDKPLPMPLEDETSIPGAPLVESPARRRGKRQSTKGARVGVFLDVANLAGAARRLHDGGVDFRRLLTTLVGGRRASIVRAYAIDKGTPGYAAFATALRDAGYKVFTKKPKTFDDGTVKADWDVGMAVDMMSLRDKLDVVVLGSGDADFLPVVAALKQAGVRVEVATFTERSARELLSAVDSVMELDESTLER